MSSTESAFSFPEVILIVVFARMLLREFCLCSVDCGFVIDNSKSITS